VKAPLTKDERAQAEANERKRTGVRTTCASMPR
jgi:hypothetical protein